MVSYYSFVASGMTITNPLWTEVYLDAIVNKELTTVVLPVYVPRGVND